MPVRLNRLICLVCMTLCFLVAASGAASAATEGAAANPGLEAGAVFPDVPLVGPIPSQEAAYLGLAGDREPYRLSAMDAGAVIIEIFSMYCPYCQREAPVVNDLFAQIQNSPYRDRIKLIGIGAGNSKFEVDFFKKKYSVPFPLFVDPDLSIHKAVGSVGTPFFYVLAREGRDMRVLLTHVGPLPPIEEFLQRVVDAAKLKK